MGRSEVIMELIVGVILISIHTIPTLSLSHAHSLSHTLSHTLTIYLSIYLSIYLIHTIYLSIYLSITPTHTHYRSLSLTHTHIHTLTISLSHTHTGRLPPDLWASISGYYYNNRNNKVLEEWGGKGLYVNWWETDVYFIPMPWDLKVIS